ncbi:MAG: HD domain-containing protein [Lachnospiraceae bacterium]|nr:HD domain-containing protein [Lachnospiraceae bacterium]MCI9471481.1 HD domain-containing protein [Lachnospiraceae bacterium]
MDTADFRKIQKKLYKKLDSHRYQHTLGVMYTCAALAMVHGVDLGKAQTAGLLHDCAKCIPNEKKLKLCKKHEIPVTPFEKENPFLIHAKLGAYLARKKYKVEDEEILSAIRCHTTGKEAMTALEQILFIADYIEPTRSTAPHLERLRRLAFQDLDQCTYEILRDTLTYLRQSPQKIDETTERAYGYYRERNEKRHG